MLREVSRSLSNTGSQRVVFIVFHRLRAKITWVIRYRDNERWLVKETLMCERGGGGYNTSLVPPGYKASLSRRYPPSISLVFLTVGRFLFIHVGGNLQQWEGSLKQNTRPTQVTWLSNVSIIVFLHLGRCNWLSCDNCRVLAVCIYLFIYLFIHLFDYLSIYLTFNSYLLISFFPGKASRIVNLTFFLL